MIGPGPGLRFSLLSASPISKPVQAVKMQLRSLIVALALGATSAFMRPASVSRVTARLASQRPSYPEVLRGLREAAAARRCKRGASAVR